MISRVRFGALVLAAAPVWAAAGDVPSALQQRLRPVDDLAQVALGDAHACAITEQGGVVCWGDNEEEQLGNGDGDAPHPVPVDGLAGATIRLAAGRAHTCALIAGGHVQCWGDNVQSQLGNAAVFPGSPAPVAVQDLARPVLQLTSGSNHSCVIVQGGSVQCWGISGQLGSGNTNDADTAQNVALPSTAIHIAASESHTCAVLTGGAVYC